MGTLGFERSHWLSRKRKHAAAAGNYESPLDRAGSESNLARQGNGAPCRSSVTTPPPAPGLSVESLPPPGARPTWLGWAVGLVASVVTIVTAVAAFKGSLGPNYVIILFCVVITAFTIIVMYLLRRFTVVISDFRVSVEALNAQIDGIKNSHQVVSRTLVLAREINEEVSEFRSVPTSREVATFSRNAVRNMARTFSESLGSECRVCVKQVRNDASREPWTEAIARSDRSVEADIGVKHLISRNTDFSLLSRRRETVWFCPDIRAYPEYETTSNMPTYRSTIVWPVITRVAAEDAPGPEFAPIVAYLCLDSDTPGLFDYEEHVPLGWVVCDALARLFEAQKSIWVS